MENTEITEARLIASGWKKIGNTFYNNGKAITHFDSKFEYWNDGKHFHVKQMSEIQYINSEAQKKPTR